VPVNRVGAIAVALGLRPHTLIVDLFGPASRQSGNIQHNPLNGSELINLTRSYVAIDSAVLRRQARHLVKALAESQRVNHTEAAE